MRTIWETASALGANAVVDALKDGWEPYGVLPRDGGREYLLKRQVPGPTSSSWPTIDDVTRKMLSALKRRGVSGADARGDLRPLVRRYIELAHRMGRSGR